jgi:hypothetical protein
MDSVYKYSYSGPFNPLSINSHSYMLSFYSDAYNSPANVCPLYHQSYDVPTKCFTFILPIISTQHFETLDIRTKLYPNNSYAFHVFSYCQHASDILPNLDSLVSPYTDSVSKAQ